jgi:hypothetical protein
MNANHNVNFAAGIEQQLASINMSPEQRRQVLHDERIAEAIVGAVEWVCGKLKRPDASVFAKPSPKY